MVAALAAAVPLLAAAIPAATNAYNTWKANQVASQQTAAQAAAAANHVAKGTHNDPAVIANALANAAQGTAQGTYTQALMSQLPTLMNTLPAAFSSAVSPTGQIVANPLQLGLSQLAQQTLQQPSQAQITEHINQAGRAQVNRVAAEVNPQLETIQRQLTERQTQLAATAEHRRIVEREKRWNGLRAELNGIRRAIGDRERY